MTEDDLEAETRRLQAETRLLLAKRDLRHAKHSWLMAVPASAFVFVGVKP